METGTTLDSSGDFLLDTGIVLRYLRQDKRAADLFDHLEQSGSIQVSMITFLETLVGCRPGEKDATLLFFDRVIPVEVDREVARKAASLIKSYPHIFGKEIRSGTADALIAGTAWQCGCILLTFNTRQFAREAIAELSVLPIDQNARDWTELITI